VVWVGVVISQNEKGQANRACLNMVRDLAHPAVYDEARPDQNNDQDHKGDVE